MHLKNLLRRLLARDYSELQPQLQPALQKDFAVKPQGSLGGTTSP